jgi:broad specificity phosphatase PhoE
MPISIVFIRHAESEHNAAHIIQGTLDSPLSSKGMAQILHAAPTIAARFPTASRVYSSPLQRARSTAERIAAALNPPHKLEINSNLIERALGSIQGVARKDVKKHVFFNTLKSSHTNSFVPPDGETLGELDARIDAFMLEVVRAHSLSSATRDDEDVVVIAVTHGGVLARIIALR